MRPPQNHFRRLAMISLPALSLGAALWALAWPIPQPGDLMDLQSDQPLPIHASATLLDDATPTDGNSPAWNRRLQPWRPAAIGAPLDIAERVVDVDANRAGLGLRLLGTIMEPGHSFAIVADRHGSIDIQPAATVLQLEPAGIRLESIERNSARVSYQGSQHTLNLAAIADIPPAQVASHDLPGVMEQDDKAPTQDMSLEDELDWLNGEETAVPQMGGKP